MNLAFGMLGALGFVFGLNAYVQLGELKKRVAALELTQGSRVR